MEGLVILGLVISALAALDFAALRFGADSRPTVLDHHKASRILTS